MYEGISMTKWTRIAGMVGGLALAIAGCGSDDADGSPGPGNGNTGGGAVASGLPATKPLNTLTPAEVTQICKAVDDSVKSPAVSDGMCKFLAVIATGLEASFVPGTTDAQLRMSCTEGFEECKKDTEPEDCDPPPASCTATVAEVEKCASDLNAAIIAVGTAAPACATLTKAALSTAPSIDALVEPASCKALEQKCPGFVEEPGMN
jgi:hypothetical protein